MYILIAKLCKFSNLNLDDNMYDWDMINLQKKLLKKEFRRIYIRNNYMP